MATTKAFFGFFFQEGSQDYPSNMNPNEPFGFTAGGSVPVFDYSIVDVQRSFVTPSVLSRNGYYFNTRASKLILERFEHTYVDQIDPTTNDDWGKIFRILEYIYNHQLAVTSEADLAFNGTTGYLNAGDEVFYTGVSGLLNIGDPVRSGNFGYQLRSFKYDPSAFAERVSAVEFNYKLGTGDLYTFRVYLDPNAFIERSDNAKYDVYQYEEVVDDGLIDQGEFSSQIVAKLFDLNRNGLYNRWDEFDTIKRVDKVVDGVPTKVDVATRFYVFTTYRAAPSQITLRAFVKEYLRGIFANPTQLKATYPALFNSDSVDIIPLYENLVTTFGNAQQLLAHPVPLEAIRTKMIEFQLEFNPASSEYLPTEIFYVGGDEDTNPNTQTRNIFPLIAVEQSADSGVTTRPISKRFPEYKPLSGLPYGTGNTVAQQFHHFLVLALNVLDAVIELNSIPTQIRNTYSFRSTTEAANAGGSLVYDVVIFEYENVVWSVYGKKRAV